ncbi:MAG: DUF2269 domain-containing protein [Gammaproteobacteria bacterium]|nr:MAG: DUF2269 domain-containing protein [Gammaproteobacteria bacterium]
MDNYLLIKYLHILSAFILAGTGVGIAFFMWMATRTKNISVIVITAKHVILADWIFTAPAILVQFITGSLLMEKLQYSFESPWFMSVFSLFVFVGFCWVPVIVLQYRLKKLAIEAEAIGILGGNFYRVLKYWVALGIPAFIGILIIVWLMVFKPLDVV